MKAKFLFAFVVMLLSSCTTIYIIYPPLEKEKVQFKPTSIDYPIIEGQHRAKDVYFFPLPENLKKYQNIKADETGGKEG